MAAARREPSTPPPRDDAAFALPAATPAAAELGLGLDQLSAALAGMLTSGDDPYVPAPTPDAPVEADDAAASDACCEITPRSILEAMLFVGGPLEQPLSSRRVAALMRGVRPAEIDAAVRQLNADYRRRRCPYQIVAEHGGYRMQLCDAFARLRAKVYGKARQARLSQAAIEVLAAVAYHEPIAAEEVCRLRGAASGNVLTMLVRRQLLRLERGASGEPRRVLYYTTPRFLELFRLSSLADLPRSGELERP